MGRRGWINDPNGPIFFNGRYHLFYQHLTTGCEWDWGLVWGHAISTDLIHWEHLPPALRPTPGFSDADGCFSGCCTIDANGVPTILYTGVRLRSNPECGPLPPTDCDLQLPFIETQLLATADAKDQRLVSWTKVQTPFLALPPPSLPLTGWRDPFVIQRGNGRDVDWVILMGAGLKGEGGTTLIYRATELASTWVYEGLLCLGDPDLGAMWECPLLLEIPAAPGVQPGVNLSVAGPTNSKIVSAVDDNALIFSHSAATLQQNAAAGKGDVPPLDPRYSHFYCVSPDAPTNPVIYWMGEFTMSDVKFHLERALGPFRLDLGDTIYAPNILEDESGRQVLWAWVQEHRKVGTYEYSGCMATPRILLARNNQLFQQPIPELHDVRQGAGIHWADVEVPDQMMVPMVGVSGRCLDMEVSIRQGSSLLSGFVLHSWNAAGEGSAAVLFDWESNMLEVMFEALDPDTLQFSLSAPSSRRVGGKIEHASGDLLHLRVILDHSLLEIFTGNGQALTTRVYRGTPPSGDPGLDFLSVGGTATIEHLNAWELDTIWKDAQALKAPKSNAAFAQVSTKLEDLNLKANKTELPARVRS